MVTSDFVFEEGEGIDVGTHGDHDYVFADGEPVPDTGQSTIVFEDGTGIGGNVWNLNEYGGLDATLDTSIIDVEARISYTNGSTGDFAAIWRDSPIDISNGFDVTFVDVQSDKGLSDDNKGVGLSSSVTSGSPGTNRVSFTVEETETGENQVMCTTPGVEAPNTPHVSGYPYPGPTTLRIAYDGGEYVFYVDSSEVARVTQSDTGTYYPYLNLEGELGDDWLQVGSVDIS